MLESRKNIFCYLMVAPALILVILLGILPMIQSLRMAFVEYNLLTLRTKGTPFVGLDNFEYLFSDSVFIQTLVQTIMFVVIVERDLQKQESSKDMVKLLIQVFFTTQLSIIQLRIHP